MQGVVFHGERELEIMTFPDPTRVRVRSSWR